MRLWTAAIVGLGRIGQGEEGRPDWLWTHARALHQHPRFRLIAGVDPDKTARERFFRTYGVPAWPTLEQMNGGADVYVIAVPTSMHFQVFNDVLRWAPQAIICEKPLAATVREAEIMVDVAARLQVPLLVNYMRRFDPNTQRLRRRMNGSHKAAVACYSNGFLENGSHFIDLFAYLLPPFSDATILRGTGDNLDVRLQFGDTTAYLLSVPEGQLEPKFVGKDVLRFQFDPSYQLHVLDALVERLDEDAPLPSDGHTALETLRICRRVMECVPA